MSRVTVSILSLTSRLSGYLESVMEMPSLTVSNTGELSKPLSKNAELSKYR